ncbi:hypothetical protein C8R44DRAFT_740100 [Mycena epipterygia]|nr:hypothetical protein C8R44DRAFT_740100 [Mycena epipterygia]
MYCPALRTARRRASTAMQAMRSVIPGDPKSNLGRGFLLPDQKPRTFRVRPDVVTFEASSRGKTHPGQSTGTIASQAAERRRIADWMDLHRKRYKGVPLVISSSAEDSIHHAGRNVEVEERHRAGDSSRSQTKNGAMKSDKIFSDIGFGFSSEKCIHRVERINRAILSELCDDFMERNHRSRPYFRSWTRVGDSIAACIVVHCLAERGARERGAIIVRALQPKMFCLSICSNKNLNHTFLNVVVIPLSSRSTSCGAGVNVDVIIPTLDPEGQIIPRAPHTLPPVSRLSPPPLHPFIRASMPSLTQIVVLATVIFVAFSTAAPVAVPGHTVTSLPAILTAAFKPVCASLASINIGNATADIVTPLTNEVKSILSAAVSEASALAGSPPSTILSAEGCACSRTSSSSSSDDNSLSAPDGVLSVPEDNSDILSVNDVAQLLASIPSYRHPSSRKLKGYPPEDPETQGHRTALKMLFEGLKKI